MLGSPQPPISCLFQEFMACLFVTLIISLVRFLLIEVLTLAQTGLEVTMQYKLVWNLQIFLPQSLKCRNHNYAPPCSASQLGRDLLEMFPSYYGTHYKPHKTILHAGDRKERVIETEGSNHPAGGWPSHSGCLWFIATVLPFVQTLPRKTVDQGKDN